MSRPKSSVTLRDVAKKAGVSAMAVSKVLNGKGDNVRVGESVAQAIRDAANELGYRPNAIARSLRRQRTDTIGVLFEHFVAGHGMPDYTTLLLEGIFQTAFDNGFSVTICPKLSRATDPREIDDGRFDGVVWCKVVSDPEVFRALDELRVPTVALNTPPPRELGRVSFVACDNEGGIRQSVEYLASLGHQHIGYVYEASCTDVIETRVRMQALIDVAAEHGIMVRQEDLLGWSDFADEFPDWWQSRPAPTALVCRSDRIAGGILRHAEDIGARIPDQLSVVGFDSSLYCELTKPRLTAIYQPVEQMAARATQLLIDRIQGDTSEAVSLVYPCGFDVRESTGPPP